MNFSITPDHVMLSAFSRNGTAFPTAQTQPSRSSSTAERSTDDCGFPTSSLRNTPGVESTDELRLREMLLESLAGGGSVIEEGVVERLSTRKRRGAQTQQPGPGDSKRRNSKAVMPREESATASGTFRNDVVLERSRSSLPSKQIGPRSSIAAVDRRIRAKPQNHIVSETEHPQSTNKEERFSQNVPRNGSEHLAQPPIPAQMDPRIDPRLQALGQYDDSRRQSPSAHDRKRGESATRCDTFTSTSNTNSLGTTQTSNNDQHNNLPRSATNPPQSTSTNNLPPAPRDRASHSSMLEIQQARLIMEMAKLQEANAAMSEELAVARDAFPRMNYAASRIWDNNQYLQGRNMFLEGRNAHLENAHYEEVLASTALRKEMEELRREKEGMAEELRRSRVVVAMVDKFAAELGDKAKDILEGVIEADIGAAEEDMPVEGDSNVDDSRQRDDNNARYSTGTGTSTGSGAESIAKDYSDSVTSRSECLVDDNNEQIADNNAFERFMNDNNEQIADNIGCELIADDNNDQTGDNVGPEPVLRVGLWLEATG